jgi:ribosomal protein S12 methylthiotransferase accessory factor
LIEREAIALWWFAGAPAKELDAAEVPGLRECVATMRAGRTERRLIFLDLTTEFAIPVVAAVSADAEGKDLAAGFAARLEVGEAAVAAVCELAQMELANLLASAKRQRGMRLTESEAALLDRCRDLSLEDALFKAGTAQKGDAIARPRDVSNLDVMLAEQGIERFVVELTSPILTVPVAKVVCPALQTVPVGYRTERFRAASEKYGLRSGAASRYGPI